MNIDSLPHRLPASLVCRLAGYSKSTLINRIKMGLMPPPVDRGRENLFDKWQVLERLGIGVNTETVNPFIKALNDKAAKIRQHP